MKKLVKALFFLSWLVSVILVGYMLYITVLSTYNPRELWGYIVMYALTLIGSSLLTFTVLFPSREGQSRSLDDTGNGTPHNE